MERYEQPKGKIDMKILNTLVGAFIFLSSNFALADSNLIDRINMEKERVGKVTLSCQDYPTINMYGEANNNFNFYVEMEKGKSHFSHVLIRRVEGQLLNPWQNVKISDSRIEKGILAFGPYKLKIDLNSSGDFMAKFDADLTIDGQKVDGFFNCYVSEIQTGE